MTPDEQDTIEFLNDLGFFRHHNFISKLQSDHGWTIPTAYGAVQEYIRFVFLAKHSGHIVIPSEMVDKVWHTHLLYTRHYWNCMCMGVNYSLHHCPSGDTSQQEPDYVKGYGETLKSYNRYFGSPPLRFWPQPGVDKKSSTEDTAIKAGALTTVIGFPLFIIGMLDEKLLLGLFIICLLWLVFVLIHVFTKKRKNNNISKDSKSNKSNDSGGWFPWTGGSSCSSSSDSDSSSGSSCGSSCSSSCGGGGGY